MKTINLLIYLVVMTICPLSSQVKIIVFDVSGSFIGPNTPEILKQGSLQKINEIINIATHNDTIIFFPIRENSTISSLNQTILIKAKAKTVFDPGLKRKNKKLVGEFANKVLAEINKPYAKSTDIISAINYASAIAKNYRSAEIFVFSDGQDNVNAKLFKRLDNISITHLFVFHKNSERQNQLLLKWQTIYKDLGAKSVSVLDAQSSLTSSLGSK